MFTRAVIIANGPLSQPPTLDEQDFLIAADGGAKHCLHFGLSPAVVIGDQDSLAPAELEHLQAQGAEVIQFPSRKDYTDLELALRYAQQHGFQRALLVAALGERWDMTLANLLLPAALPQMDIRLLDGRQEIFLLRPGRPVAVNGQPGDTLSLVPIGGDALGVLTEGLEYPLHAERLIFGATRGISNVVQNANAQVRLESGLLLVVLIRK